MSTTLSFHLVITNPVGEISRFDLPAGVTLIGRQPGATLVLPQQSISRQHARINCEGQECFLIDLNSANGTMLDGKRIQAMVPYRLVHGAVIGIGDFNLGFEQIQVEVEEPEKPATYEDILVPAAPQEAPQESAPADAGGEEALPSAEGYQPALEAAIPPAGPPPPPPSGADPYLPGMGDRSRFFINFLPEIYRTTFMECFLGIFESVMLPIEWSIDNFDLYLSPATAPSSFLPWLCNWYSLAFDGTWSEPQRRALLAEAHQIYAMRGTRWALSRLLEIYTGQKPRIIDTGKDQKPYTFTVRVSGDKCRTNRKFIQRLIEENKPAHTAFVLEFEEGA